MEKIEERLKLRVRQLRSDAGLSQVALANLAGVSVQTIKDVEAGRRGLGLKALEGISVALGITIEQLKGESIPVVEKVSTFKAKKALSYFGSIPDNIYELASKLGADHEIWEEIAEYLIEEIDHQKKAGKKTNGD